MITPPVCRSCDRLLTGRGGPRRHGGRGLCWSCYGLSRRNGTLTDFGRITRSRDELLADYTILRREGHSLRQIAERLNMAYPAFERAIMRARAAGDVRAA